MRSTPAGEAGVRVCVWGGGAGGERDARLGWKAKGRAGQRLGSRSLCVRKALPPRLSPPHGHHHPPARGSWLLACQPACLPACPPTTPLPALRAPRHPAPSLPASLAGLTPPPPPHRPAYSTHSCWLPLLPLISPTPSHPTPSHPPQHLLHRWHLPHGYRRPERVQVSTAICRSRGGGGGGAPAASGLQRQHSC